MASDTDFVWRLESTDGRGPYRGMGELTTTAIGDYFSPSRHPLPWDDGISGNLSPDHVCGFKSVEQAKAWWYQRQDANHFDQAGVVLAAWRRSHLESVHDGGRQSTFIRQGVRATFPVHLLWDSDPEELASMANAMIPVIQWQSSLTILPLDG